VARKRQQITEVGQWLDPLTDRILIVAIVTALYLRDRFISLPLLAVFLGRDLLIVSGAILLKLQKKKIAVSVWGKLATFILFFAILLLSAKQTKVGLIFLYIGLLFYLGSGFNYFWQGKKLLGGLNK
jgi:cardiolipin synthase